MNIYIPSNKISYEESTRSTRKRYGFSELLADLTPSQANTYEKYGLIVMISASHVPYLYSAFMTSNIARISQYHSGRFLSTAQITWKKGCITINEMAYEHCTPSVLARSLLYRLRSKKGEEHVYATTRWGGSFSFSEKTLARFSAIFTYDEYRERVIIKHILSVVPRAIVKLKKEMGIKNLNIDEVFRP